MPFSLSPYWRRSAVPRPKVEAKQGQVAAAYKSMASHSAKPAATEGDGITNDRTSPPSRPGKSRDHASGRPNGSGEVPAELSAPLPPQLRAIPRDSPQRRHLAPLTEQELREMRHQLAAAIAQIDHLLAELAEDETRRTDFDPSRLAAD